MPNPVTMIVKRDGFAQIGRDASYHQRVSFRQSGKADIVVSVLPGASHRVDIDAGTWEVTYEYSEHVAPQVWQLGKGKLVNPEHAIFDDGPVGQGDHSYNDTVVRIYYPS